MFYIISGKNKIKEDFKVLTKKQTELSRIVGQGNDSHHSKVTLRKGKTPVVRVKGAEAPILTLTGIQVGVHTSLKHLI